VSGFGQSIYKSQEGGWSVSSSYPNMLRDTNQCRRHVRLGYCFENSGVLNNPPKSAAVSDPDILCQEELTDHPLSQEYCIYTQ